MQRQQCQPRGHPTRLANTLVKDEESARDNHVFACNFAKYSPVLKYAATLPCNLSLRARFADINVVKMPFLLHSLL